MVASIDGSTALQFSLSGVIDRLGGAERDAAAPPPRLNLAMSFMAQGCYDLASPIGF